MDQLKKRNGVVAMVPYQREKVVLQLRDLHKKIIYPGCWGLLSGTIEDGETAEAAAKRELREEIGHFPPSLLFLGKFPIPSEGNVSSYVYYFPLSISLSEVQLYEGVELGLFSQDEIWSKKLYSTKLGGNYPIINSAFLLETLEKVFACIKKNSLPRIVKSGCRSIRE